MQWCAALVAFFLIPALGAQTPTTDATALIRDGKPAEAILLLEKQLARTPADLRARNLLGIALSNSGKHEDAIAQFRQVLEQDPRFLPALKNLAASELQLGRDADARGHFETALAAAPNDPAVHVGLAQIDYRARLFEPALEHLRRVPAAASGPLHFEAGLLLAKLEQFASAAQEFALARAGGVDAYDAGFNLTLAQLNARNYGVAVDAAKELVARGLATSELYSLLSQAYEAGGRTAEAYDALRASAEANPRDQDPYLELIALCVAHENYDLALEIAGVGLRVNPDAFLIRVDRGVVLAVTGRLEEAEQEFARAALSAPAETLPQLARSIALMELGRLPEAVETLRGLTRAHADDYLVSWHLAEALIRTGDEGRAEAAGSLRRSIGQNPSVARTRFLLGKLLAQEGKTAEAIAELEAALRLDANDVSATYLLAQAYRKQGDTARSSELFAKVTQAKAEAAERESARRSLLRIVRAK